MRDILKRCLTQQRQFADPATSKKALHAEQRELELLEIAIDAISLKLERQTHAVIKRASDQGAELVKRAYRVSRDQIIEARAVERAVKSWQRAVPKEMERALAKAKADLTKQAEDLQLSPNDIFGALSRPKHQQKGVSVTTKTHRTQERVQKTGAWNAVKRFFGANSGWTTITHEHTHVRTGQLRRQVSAAVDYEVEWARTSAVRVASHVEDAIAVVRKRLEGRRQALEQKRSNALEAEERTGVIRTIQAILQRLDEEIAAARPSVKTTGCGNTASADEAVEVDVPAYLPPLIKLGSRLRNAGFLAARDQVLARAGKGAKHVTIWGWDADSLERFVTRFWHDHLRLEDLAQAPVTVSRPRSGFSSVSCVDETRLQKYKSSPRYLPVSLPRTDVLVLVLDVVQPGCTMSQLASSSVAKRVGPRTKLVVAPQAIRPLEHSGELGEGLAAAHEMAATLSCPSLGMLVNDPCLAYTVLADLLCQEGHTLRTHADELAWAKRISELPLDERQSRVVGEALRGWRRHQAQGPKKQPAKGAKRP